MHSHDRLRTEDQARLIRKGELDVQLLQDAGLHIDPSIGPDPTVKVAFDSICLNVNLGRGDPVFLTFAQSGQFLGHYFASAFKSLTH